MLKSECGRARERDGMEEEEHSEHGIEKPIHGLNISNAYLYNNKRTRNGMRAK